MKKLIKIALVCTFILSIAACSDHGNNTNTVSDIESAVESIITSTESFTVFEKKPTIEETVLVDESNVKITAKSLEYSDYSATLNLTIENNTDKSLSFISGSLGYNCNAINDYMMDGMYINEDVEPGKKFNAAMYINADNLKTLGISDIKDIQIGFEIEDEDYNEYLVTGPITLTTSLEKTDDIGFLEAIKNTSLQNEYGYSIDYSNEDVLSTSNLMDLKNVVVVETESTKTLSFEVTNKSDQNLYAVISDVAMNGILLSSHTYDNHTVSAGKSAVMTIRYDYLIEEGYEELFGLNNVGCIEFNYSVYDADYREITTEHITINLNDNYEINTEGTELYNNNALTITYKDMIEDGSYIHILFLVKNNSDKELDVDEDYNTTSLNDYMCSSIIYGLDLPSGYYGVYDVEIPTYTLDDIDITSVDEITSFETGVELRDADYNDIDTFKLTVER